MIALVADLAYRCVRLNAHLEESAARLTPGIVMIDEVDMHLHPSWQQVVVELLQEAFPSIQFILTTNSLRFLPTVDFKSIRLIRLESGVATISTPQFQTRGVESADVLAEVIGIDPVPDVEPARRLIQYVALIQQDLHETDSGRALRTGLEAHFGTEHPLIRECQRLVRLRAFKRQLPLRGS